MRHDGFLGHHFSLIALAKHGRHAGKHAGAQAHLAVVDAGAHAHGPAIGVDQRVHGLNEGDEFAAWQRVKADACRLALLYFVLKALRQSEIDKHCIDVFDVHHIRTVFQIITHVGGADAHRAVKRGHHL